MGKIARAGRRARWRWVHPHSRGENFYHHVMDINEAGSSPLAWGKSESANYGNTRARFIPTRVGKISIPWRRRGSRSVHPHSRGENLRPRRLRTIRNGSSPLAWGKWPDARDRCCRRGFIPTRVGKMRLKVLAPATAGVHPHSRGENPWRPRNNANALGSSPLAWGKSIRPYQHIIGLGLIPTRVGKIFMGMFRYRL